jgi:hypothetical protein
MMGDSRNNTEGGQGGNSALVEIHDDGDHVANTMVQQPAATERSPLLPVDERQSSPQRTTNGAASENISSLNKDRHKKAAGVISFLLIGESSRWSLEECDLSNVLQRSLRCQRR